MLLSLLLLLSIQNYINIINNIDININIIIINIVIIMVFIYCSTILPSATGAIVSKWHWQDFSQVRLAQLFLSKTGMISPRCDWCDCFQVRLTQLFLSVTGTFVPSETDTIFTKWDWYETGTSVSKRILTLQFLFCFAVSSLTLFFTRKGH